MTTAPARPLASRLGSSHLIWPAVALVALLIFNVFMTEGFLSLRITDGHLYGSLINILRNGAPTLLIAVGMTLVIATRGIDLSVGAVAAIAGAVTCTYMAGTTDPASARSAIIGMSMALALCVALGLWNGFLVSVVGIQPIIATLVLMTAGRGIAMLFTDGQIITVKNGLFRQIGAGYALLPISILISVGVLALVALITRRTALGMLIESVGINPEASRLAGVRSRTIIWTVYVFCALCAGVAGLMISSNTTAADANSAGLWIEMDAILAVVIGGTSLAGGRYSLTGTLLGALVIQTLTTTVLTVGLSYEIGLVFKAAVVIAVCTMQSPQLRFGRRGHSAPPPAPVPDDTTPTKLPDLDLIADGPKPAPSDGQADGTSGTQTQKAGQR